MTAVAEVRARTVQWGLRLSPFATRRTPGEWVVDSMLFAVSLSYWWYNGWALADYFPAIQDWYWPLDRALGLLACVLIWWMRAYPRSVALILIVPGSLAVSAGLAVLLGIHRVGLLAAPRSSILITAAHIACALPYHWVLPLPGMPWLVWIVVIPLLYALVLCIGLLGRSRQQVIEGLRASAARDRERYEDHLARTRRDERERIAREMHDVLAHRVSLLSVHAGALEYRTATGVQERSAPTPAEIHTAAVVIRENAHRAVEDLQELLTVLREDDDLDPSLSTARPPARLEDIHELIAEARAAGELVELDLDADPAAVRESVQRTVYRVVQEGLTNARKHAPRARVWVSVATSAEGVRAEVTNPVAVGMTSTDIPGGGSGLVGLAERVRLDGGTLRSCVDEGSFRLVAHIPGGPR